MAYEYRGGEDYHTREDFEQEERIKEKGGSRALVCFCIDISESMTLILQGQEHKIDHSRDGRTFNSDAQQMHAVFAKRGHTLESRISKLNTILERLLKKMKANSTLCDMVVISIITFAADADIKNSFLDVGIIDPSRYANLEIAKRANQTCTGKALQLALEQIEYAQSRFSDWDIDMRKSTIIFLSDGEPTDTDSYDANTVTVGSRTFRNDANSVAAVIREMVKENVINFVPILIGEGNARAHSYMSSLTPQRDYFTMKSEADYERIFNLIEQDFGSRVHMLVQDENSDYMASVEVETSKQESVVDTNVTGMIQMDESEIMKLFASGVDDGETPLVDGTGSDDEDDEFTL